MRELYLDKSALLLAHRKPLLAAAAVVLVLGLVPIRREYVEEKFVLEPARRAVLRTEVPGRVTHVFADEGQTVGAGAAVAELSDITVDAQAARAAADYATASSRAITAQLQYADYAGTEEQRKRFATEYNLALDQQRRLTLKSPIAGIVVTPRVHDMMGRYVAAGTEIVEVAETSSMRARIYVPEPEMRKLTSIHHADLRANSAWAGIAGSVVSISPAPQAPDASLVSKAEYSGMDAAQYFAVTVLLPNPAGELRDGMTGTAKIFGRRRALIALLLQPVVNGIARRVW